MYSTSASLSRVKSRVLTATSEEMMLTSWVARTLRSSSLWNSRSTPNMTFDSLAKRYGTLVLSSRITTLS